MLSIVIPSKNEIFLQKTILDVLEKATGEIEVLPILDGYEPPNHEIVTDPRVRYIKLPSVHYSQKRQGINKAISEAKGKYVMSLDAHCMMAIGFDVQLINDHQPNWVQIPRRHRLDAENWSLQLQSDNRPPIDYEYIMWPLQFNPVALHGFKWDARTRDRSNLTIDDTVQFQGSCWFMTKKWFQKMGFMQVEGYTGWGQEAEEISLTTWKNGGRVVTNKNTWYAHLHKGPKYGRMYHLSRDENRRSYEYSYNKWVIENKDFFASLIEKFGPMPGWPQDWKNQLWPENKTIIKQTMKTNDAVGKPDATIIYLTSNVENIKFEHRIRKELEKNSHGLPILSVSRKPTRFGKKNINLGNLPINEATSLKQLLAGLEEAKTEFAIIAKDDFAYPPEYFSFTPPTDNHAYRYENIWTLGDKFWKKDPSEFAQVVNRKFWIEKIKKSLSSPNDESDKIPPVFNREEIITFSAPNPVINFRTTSGLRRFPSVLRHVRPQRTMPFWGGAIQLKERMEHQ